MRRVSISRLARIAAIRAWSSGVFVGVCVGHRSAGRRAGRPRPPARRAAASMRNGIIARPSSRWSDAGLEAPPGGSVRPGDGADGGGPVARGVRRRGPSSAAREAPAGGAVMVLSSKGGVCTGVVLAPDTVLTAGHCAADARGAPGPFPRRRRRAGAVEVAARARASGLRCRRGGGPAALHRPRAPAHRDAPAAALRPGDPERRACRGRARA